MLNNTNEHSLSNIMIHNNPRFLDALEGLQSFILDTSADIDMAYDWVCEMTNIYNICDDDSLWNQFYDAYYEAADWELISALNDSVGYDF